MRIVQLCKFEELRKDANVTAKKRTWRIVLESLAFTFPFVPLLYFSIYNTHVFLISPSISPQCFLLPTNFSPHFIRCSSSALLSLLFSHLLLPRLSQRNSCPTFSHHTASYLILLSAPPLTIRHYLSPLSQHLLPWSWWKTCAQIAVWHLLQTE